MDDTLPSLFIRFFIRHIVCLYQVDIIVSYFVFSFYPDLSAILSLKYCFKCRHVFTISQTYFFRKYTIAKKSYLGDVISSRLLFIFLFTGVKHELKFSFRVRNKFIVCKLTDKSVRIEAKQKCSNYIEC